VDHDLARVVTVRKNVQKIGLGHEIETGECSSLGVHEIEESFLANTELLINFLKIRDNPFLTAVNKSDLLRVGVLQDALDIRVNSNELLRFPGQFLLYFSGVDEELFQEGPVTLHFTGKKHYFRDLSKSLLPFDASFFEG